MLFIVLFQKQTELILLCWRLPISAKNLAFVILPSFSNLDRCASSVDAAGPAPAQRRAKTAASGRRRILQQHNNDARTRVARTRSPTGGEKRPEDHDHWQRSHRPAVSPSALVALSEPEKTGERKRRLRGQQRDPGRTAQRPIIAFYL